MPDISGETRREDSLNDGTSKKGGIRLHLVEWLVLALILIALVYSTILVRRQDMKDLEQFMGYENSALEEE